MESEENSGKGKQKRGANFSLSDRKNLLKLSNKFKAVIENKKTDGVTWRQKEEAWIKIEREFNSFTTGVPRTAKQLKTKYEAIKKELKKKYSSHKCYMLGTGGGASKEEPKPETEEEKELLQTIIVSVEGVRGVEIEEIENSSVIVETHEDIEWNTPSTSYLQTHIHPALKVSRPNVLQVDVSGEDMEVTDHNTDSISVAETPSSKKPWSCRRRPVIKKKKSMSSASSKFEELAMKKLELVNLQMSIAEEIKKQNAAEHKIKMENLKLKQDILKMELQIRTNDKL
ncbi:unnamed protein product [Acanthoscelides obtectus]|uniref:Regulatory protein zeste n=1 Tax=Acanthoscelides obtectus TaxID=200917 RepID=A0A9P0LCU7_ACAOB|nr:unnamed protein product [Acanthoscelides obtectus]CAH1984336.1 unnamed protein product [Acanthoscelides obtectus]CAH1993125.1 unnamed protein product [Acanthoscelides obtectus]CAH1994328.1 unnamed protein product [Acanthoscelides obtectus]CAH1994564.1 unnamed protein product [Acanthoscelides obtectus]